MTATFTESESELAVGATKRKRKRRRAPGGLGRGLARILTDNQAVPDEPETGTSGLLQLVGGESSAKAQKIRSFVVDTALSTMADGFSLDGVVLAVQGPRPAGGSNAELAGPPDNGPGHDPTGAPISNGSMTDGSVAGGPMPGAQPLPFDNLPPPVDAAKVDSIPASGPPPNTAADVVDGAPTFLAARLPPSWSAESQVLFEIYGNLWRILQHETDPVAPALVGARLPSPIPMQEQWQIPVGRHWVLMSRLDDGGQPVAAVAIRKASFSTAEAEAFGAVVGSVVAACSDSEEKSAARRLIAEGTSASLKTTGSEVLAEVNAEWALAPDVAASPGRRTGVGRDVDPVLAVAKAAAKACRPRCEVTFAGCSELDDVDVSIVMIKHAKHGLKLGFAVGEKGDYRAVAEAVFTAAG